MRPLLVGFGVFTAICLALVVCGVVTNEEPGLLRVDVAWPKSRFPLGVSAVPYVQGPRSSLEAQWAVDGAIRDVNQRLGFRALKYSKEHADIDVVVGGPQVPKDGPHERSDVALVEAGGYFRLDGNDAHEWVKCRITTSNTGTVFVLGLVLQHELGHCLGLTHDDSPNSIMYPVQPDGSGTHGFPPRLTDNDRKLLRGMYNTRDVPFLPPFF